MDNQNNEQEMAEKRLRFIAAELDKHDAAGTQPPAELLEEWNSHAWQLTKRKIARAERLQEINYSAEAC
jgi:hypothetical protein